MPTPTGKATDMPASDTLAESRMFEALKMTPPRSALHTAAEDTCARSAVKLRPPSPKLPSVKPTSSEKSRMPMT